MKYSFVTLNQNHHDASVADRHSKTNRAGYPKYPAVLGGIA